MKHKLKVAGLIVMSVAISVSGTGQVYAAEPYVFPVVGTSNFSNDYDAPRSNGPHHAIDIVSGKWQGIVSATNGVVESVNYPQPSWGYAVRIKGDDNLCYWYLHMNNDTYGTDDGNGGPMNAYMYDMNPGNRVVRGQLLGWVGDSGNAENTVPHLHFSVHPLNSQGRCSEDQAINPYWNLLNATRVANPIMHPQLAREVLPYTAGYKGGLNITFGDITGDGQPDTVVAGGKNGESRVNIYTSTGLASTFYAFQPSETKALLGTDVAVGDVDGDGKDELIASGYTSAGSRIAIFKYANGTATKWREFGTFGSHVGIARLASGDVNGDGKDEIIAGANAGGGPRVNVFDENGTVLVTQHVYDSAFAGGVDVAAGDVTGDTKDEIVVAPLNGGNSQVRVLDQNLTVLNQFYAYTSAYVGGVNVAVGNVITSTGKSEIATVASPGFPLMYYYNSAGTQLQSKYFIERWWVGYYDVALMDGAFNVAMGMNRRASIRY
jgi:murein DD-endopeptidase MepM/ murein hydrolase activator NlpD